MSDVMVKVENISKSFDGNKVLESVSFEVNSGEAFMMMATRLPPSSALCICESMCCKKRSWPSVVLEGGDLVVVVDEPGVAVVGRVEILRRNEGQFARRAQLEDDRGDRERGEKNDDRDRRGRMTV